MKAGGSLGCSNQKMVELKIILRRGSKAASRTRTLPFKRANFSLFKDLRRGISRVRALERRGSKKSGQYSSIISSKFKTSAFP